MVQWRYCLVMAVLLLLPTRIGSKIDDDDDEERGEDNEEEDDEDEDDEEEEAGDHVPSVPLATGRRAPSVSQSLTPKTYTATRTIKKRPLECYVCVYKSETPLRACLDPTKFRVHTMTCHSADDTCFTTVKAKGSSYEAVVRGCRSGCVSSQETTCCELNRCNNPAYAAPLIEPQVLVESNSTKYLPPNVVFFVTILLVLQTVAKVAFV